ncbi:MAG TPA: hypothetical protein PLP17_06355, partial [Oligoflexia bacterium]|nr:hypothetical protein [Oligoflexia bacterium]
SLADWLQVSWFYPRGFKREYIIETPRAYVVVGQGIVYKFIKEENADSRAPGPAVLARWQSACEEVIDNLELAPDIYLGLRLLRWVDDEPFWITQVQGRDLRYRIAAEDVDELAIVMRRIPYESRLSALLDQGDELEEPRLRALIKVLSRFYEHRLRAGMQACIEEPGLALRWIREQVLHHLQVFIEDNGSFLDPFSQLAFQEAKVFLSNFYQELRDSFVMRGQKGFVVDVHGNLTCENICFEAVGPGGKAVTITGRRRPPSGTRFSDVLSDVASLAVDLEARGDVHLAREFEEHFFAQNPEVEHAGLYPFYYVANAVMRAMQLMAVPDSGTNIAATAFLSLALRGVFGLNKPFIVAVGGRCANGADDLAMSVAEMTGGVVVAPADGAAAETYSVDLDHLQFEYLLDAVKRHIRNSTPVVLVWPLNQEEERMQIARLARDLGVRYLLVKCGLSFPEKVTRLNRASGKEFSNGNCCVDVRRLWSKSEAPWPVADNFVLNQFYVEPVIPQPDLALSVLRHLSRNG